MANIYGRQVVIPLTNKSGASVALGDVVVVDTTTDESFTTTTTAASTSAIGVAAETIANNAIGRIIVGGYASLVNVNASVTRNQFGTTHTVAKQATSSATRVAGTFCRWLKTSATPSAYIYPVDLAGAALVNPMTTSGDIIYSSDGSGTPARLAGGTAGKILTAAGAAAPAWGQGPLTTTGDLILGATGGTPTRLAIGATSGMELRSNGTTASWALPPGYEFDYVEITTSVSITGTTEAGATTCITGSTVAYDGATPVLIHVFCPRLDFGASAQGVVFLLYDGATVLGRIATPITPTATPAFGSQIVNGFYRLTPSNASHQYIVKAFKTAAGTTTFSAGAGGTGTDLPAFLRITKA